MKQITLNVFIPRKLFKSRTIRQKILKVNAIFIFRLYVLATNKRKACLAAVCLAFIGNFVALFTLIMWILNVGSASTAKILKVVTMALLGFAGKIYSVITDHCFVN